MRTVKMYTFSSYSTKCLNGVYIRAYGWATLLECDGRVKMISGADLDNDTNMDLMAILMGMSALKDKCKLIVYNSNDKVINKLNNINDEKILDRQLDAIKVFTEIQDNNVTFMNNSNLTYEGKRFMQICSAKAFEESESFLESLEIKE